FAGLFSSAATNFGGDFLFRSRSLRKAMLSTSAAQTSRKVSRRMDLMLNGAIFVVAGFGILSSVLPVFGNTLYTPKSHHDFGLVEAGAELRHRFSVRNLHPWPVEVTGIQSDCGCTKSFVGRTPPFRLLPLEAVEVVAEVDTSGRRGQLSQSIFIATNENRRSVVLSLESEVR
ncbi:MAG: hypothetical protein JWN98_2628, partial [Abditibacteriota bacterium]|nr:hypothetical protein [Abditibacteriota bacterium]